MAAGALGTIGTPAFHIFHTFKLLQPRQKIISSYGRRKCSGAFGFVLDYVLTILDRLGGYSLTPDTTSPVYPDRPIRPLPKRPLRSRLSQEAADSIMYPPAPPTSSPMFYFPYDSTDPVNEAKVHVQQNMTSTHSGNHDDYDRDRALYDDEGDGLGDEGPVMVRRSARFWAGVLTHLRLKWYHRSVNAQRRKAKLWAAITSPKLPFPARMGMTLSKTRITKRNAKFPHLVAFTQLASQRTWPAWATCVLVMTPTGLLRMTELV